MKITSNAGILDVTIVLSYREAQVLATLLANTALHGPTGDALTGILDGLERSCIPFKELNLSAIESDAITHVMRILCALPVEEFNALEDV